MVLNKMGFQLIIKENDQTFLSQYDENGKIIHTLVSNNLNLQDGMYYNLDTNECVTEQTLLYIRCAMIRLAEEGKLKQEDMHKI